LNSEEESSDAQLGITPLAFKSLVGRGHPEFSTKKQQDAQEFFLHLINVLEVIITRIEKFLTTM
jgi:ubiquitin carboxyl-terminal hydrolase 5/13